MVLDPLAVVIFASKPLSVILTVVGHSPFGVGDAGGRIWFVVEVHSREESSNCIHVGCANSDDPGTIALQLLFNGGHLVEGRPMLALSIELRLRALDRGEAGDVHLPRVRRCADDSERVVGHGEERKSRENQRNHFYSLMMWIGSSGFYTKRVSFRSGS